MTETSAANESRTDAAAAPNRVLVEVGGKQIRIEPISIRGALAVLQAARPFLQGGSDDTIASLIVTHPEAIVAIVAAATGETEEWLGDLPPDVFLELADALLKT